MSLTRSLELVLIDFHTTTGIFHCDTSCFMIPRDGNWSTLKNNEPVFQELSLDYTARPARAALYGVLVAQLDSCPN
jgi:hypothetical protein